MRTVLVPDYFNNFACLGQACEDTCCSGWNIAIDKKTFKAYKKVNDPLIMPKLSKCLKRNRKSNNDDLYAYISLDDNNNCPLLLENGLCSIHQQLGENYLSNVCATYPRITKQVGHAIEKSLTLSCPEAARQILLNENGIEFLEVTELDNSQLHISHELNLEKNPAFWEIRIFTIQLLQNRQHSIDTRLIILGLFIQKIQSLNAQELQQQIQFITSDYLNRLNNIEYISSLQNIEGNLPFQINLAREIIRYRLSQGGATEKYLSILKQLLVGLKLDETNEVNIEASVSQYKETYKTIYKPFSQNHEYIFENYIVNHVFKNLFPYDSTTFFDSYVMLIIHFSLLKIHLMGISANQNHLTIETVIECVQQLSKTVEHNTNFLSTLRESLESLGFSSMAHMFILIKS